MEFQSTPSTRRETPRFPQQSDRRGLFQSTPSTRRETGREPTIYGGVFISIHSLHTEGDDLWGGGEERNQISIHSLHTEGDPLPVPRKMQLLHFNPLPPHGGRLSHAPQMLPLLYFNPLPPHGGRPRKTARSVVSEIFQSTPSTRRETSQIRTTGNGISHFNPLPPHGGRPQNCTGKRFSFRLSLYNPAKKDAKDYILHPKK